MWKETVVIITGILISCSLFGQQDEVQLNYIERYKDIAIREMERAGVPASIKLAQGILESNAGRSTLARRANNHFGIKCGPNWQGRTVFKEDDDYDENGRLIRSCFRGYRNAEASYIAHSEFLRDPQKAFRYGFLFRLDPRDYRRWANGLKQAGYATSATYPEKLISLIERYELFKYDNMSAVDIDAPSDIVEAGILKNNDVRYVVAEEGESVEDIARRVDESVRNLISYNENLTTGNQAVNEGERVYLQPKRNSYRGRNKYHVVASGETMFSISQEYGVKLSKLYDRNKMNEGQEPAVNERIKLRGWCKVKEAPRLRAVELEELPNFEDEPIIEGELEMEEPEEGELFLEEEPAPPPAPPAPVTPSQPDPMPAPPSPETQPDVPVIIINNTPAHPAPPSQPQEEDPLEEEDPFGEEEVIPQPTNPNPNPAPPTGAVYHTVQAGDTLWNIAQRYNTTVDRLKQLNQLADNNIKIGARLRVD